MSRPILILGSGKTARDIGLWFHTKGFPVIWHAGAAYAASLQSFVHRIERREAALGQDTSLPSAMRVGRLGDALDGPPFAVIESRAEDIAAKRAAFQTTRPNLDNETLLFSNSSSILPHCIGADIAGLHFFYPTPLTELVELIIPDDWTPHRIEAAEAFVQSAGLQRVRQTPRNAFYVNRLLLPLQAEAARLFIEGASIEDIDNASASNLLSVGVWSTADEIGLDVLRAGVENYIARMSEPEAKAYSPLLSVLRAWTDAGILGKKNKRLLRKRDDADLRALVSGAAAPGGPCENPTGVFRSLLASTARSFVDDGTCTKEELSLAFSAAFGGDPAALALTESEPLRGGGNESGIATMTLNLAAEGDDANEALRQLAQILGQENIKAATITLQCDGQPSVSTTEVATHHLQRADFPVTAVMEPDAPDAVRTAADACLFQVTARPSGTARAVQEAIRNLETLTKKRPIHVIRAVVKSIRNACALPIEEALLEETRLFCALSRQNQAGKESL